MVLREQLGPLSLLLAAWQKFTSGQMESSTLLQREGERERVLAGPVVSLQLKETLHKTSRQVTMYHVPPLVRAASKSEKIPIP